MKTLLKDVSSLVLITSNKATVLRGEEAKNIETITNGAIYFGDKIEWIGSSSQAEQKIQNGELQPQRIISLKGRTIFPGFIDSHTHSVFAGNRSNEFAQKVAGATYQEIASKGGGILATVKATRKASIDELFELAYENVLSSISYGTVALEIKSGYGLDLESELKILKTVEKLKKVFPIDIIPTFLGAHDFPPEFKNRRDEYVQIVCSKMIPAVANEGLAKYCDCFVDIGYYSIEQARKIFETALKFGLKIKMHADELADVGAGKLAGEFGAISADHLLYVSDESLDSMAKSGTIATLLPGTSFFSRMVYAPARKIINKGLAVALATDFNPGSCYTENMQIILSLAVNNLGLTCEEAMAASTLNGSAALELSDKIGSLEVGKYSTFVVARFSNYIDLFYHFGINHVESVWVKGERYLYNK